MDSGGGGRDWFTAVMQMPERAFTLAFGCIFYGVTTGALKAFAARLDGDACRAITVGVVALGVAIGSELDARRRARAARGTRPSPQGGVIVVRDSPFTLRKEPRRPRRLFR